MPRKKHTGLKVFLIILIVLLILIGLPIAALYIMFYDSASKNVWHSPDYTLETFMKAYSDNIVAQSIDNTSTSNSISFSLTSDDINTILYYTMNEKLDATVKEYVKGAYLDVVDGKYYFYVNGETPFFPYFKTRACLVAEPKPLESELGFELKFIDAKVGRVGGFLDLATDVVTEDMVDDLFSAGDLGFDVDWANRRIVYRVNSILEDFDIGAGSDNIFFEMINGILTDSDNDCVSLDFERNNGMNIDLNLSSAHNASYTPTVTFTNTITTIKGEVEAATSAVDANNIKDRFLTVSKNNGEKPGQGKEIQDCLEDNANMTTRTTYVTENELSAYLRGTDLIGTVYPFIGKDLKTNKYYANFVVVSDFSVDLKENNQAIFYININVGGYDTQIRVDATLANQIAMNSSSKLVLDFTLNDISYGNIASLWDSENDKPKQIITDMIQNGFSVDGASSDVLINGKTISVVINNSMYNIGNEITTTDSQMNVQVFVPQLYHGNTAPATYFASHPTTLKSGDMYFDESTLTLYTYNGSSWGTGTIINASWLTDPANATIKEQLEALGLLP